MLLELLLE
jgi:hypothetical protein